MKWFSFESAQKKFNDNKPEVNLIYLSPEALKNAILVNDLEVFQNSPECVSGGRLLEVSRQFTYQLRQVADLIEEPLEPCHGVVEENDSSKSFFADEFTQQKCSQILASIDDYEERKAGSHSPSWTISNKV